MKRQIAVVPCYNVAQKVEKVISEIKGDTWNGEHPLVLAYNDGSSDSTDSVLYGLQIGFGCPEVILSGKRNAGLSGGMKRSFEYLMGKEPEGIDIIEYLRNGFMGHGTESPLIAIVGGDGQQRFWEIFEEVGIPVYSGKADYGFMERWNEPSDLNPNKQIKMPQERIEKERIINRLAYEALKRMGHDTQYLKSSHADRGVGFGVRDLQTNKTFSGKKLEKILSGLVGERYAFDLEVSLIAGKEGVPIHWGVRRDYGKPAPFRDGWQEKWGESAKDKLNAIRKHSGIDFFRKDYFRDLIEDVVGDALREKMASLEIGNLVLRYGGVDTEILEV